MEYEKELEKAGVLKKEIKGPSSFPIIDMKRHWPGTSIEEKMESGEEKSIPIYIFGKKYEVPEGLTIQKAMEFSGYQFIRSCGCRGGFAGHV